MWYDADWVSAPFAITTDGIIKDSYAAFASTYRGRYRTINFWDFYTYYRYNKGMTPEQIKAAYPFFYAGYQQKTYSTWENNDGGGDFWVFLPAAAAGDTSFLPKNSEANVFEIEQRGNVVSGQANAEVKTDGGVTYFHISKSADDTKIAVNSAGIDSKTTAFTFRVRTDGVARLTMSGGPTGTIYLPNTSGQWLEVTYNKISGDKWSRNTDSSDMYWFIVSDLEGTYVDVDHINAAPTNPVAFASGQETYQLTTYAGSMFQVSCNAKDATEYSLIKAPNGANIDTNGLVTWQSPTAGEYTFYVQAKKSDCVALKRIELAVCADRSAAVTKACSGVVETANYYTSASKKTYDQAKAAVDAALQNSSINDTEFAALLTNLNSAVAALEPVSPLLTNDPLTDGTSLDFSKMNVGNRSTFSSDKTANWLDAESGTFVDYGLVEDKGSIMDFGVDYKISVTKFGFQARSGFSDRLAGMQVYGSNDRVNWTKLTVAEAAYQQAYQTVDVDSQYHNEQYRYLRFKKTTEYPNVLNDTYSNMNEFAELRIWGTRYETGNPIESISISSSSATSGRIQAGNTVTVTIQGRNTLENLSVKIHGMEAGVTVGADNKYTATATMPAGSKTGNVSVLVTCKSASGEGSITIEDTTDGSSLILIDPDTRIDTKKLAAQITSNCNPHKGDRTREENAGYLFDGNLKNFADLSNNDGYYIIDFGAGVTVKLEEALILPRNDDTVTVAVRTNGMTVYGSNDTPVINADGTLDDSKVTWTALTTAVTGASLGTPNESGKGGAGRWCYVSTLDGIGETGYRFFKLAGATKGDAAEVELYGTCTVDLAETAKQITSLPDQEAGATKLNCPGVSADITVAVKSSDPTGIVAGDGTITSPLNDTKVKLVLTLTSKGTSADTPEIEVTIKGLKSLLTAPSNPIKGDTTLNLPTVPNGYTVSVSYSSNTNVIATGTGAISAPVADTEVKVKLTLTRTSDSSTVESDEFTVTVPGTGGVAKIEINSTDYNIIASTNRNNAGTDGNKGTVKGMAELLFDNDTSTFGNLTASDGFYVIDFGPTKAVAPVSFQLYPRADQLGRLKNTTISGSNDYVTWDEIARVETAPAAASWVEIAANLPQNITGYRYLKISGSSYGNIGEVRIYGTVNTVEKQTDLVALNAGMIQVSGSNSATGANLVDGRWDTIADITADKSAYYTIDFGEGKAITPAKFHLSPRSDAKNENESKMYLPAMNGTTIYGSNNNSDWTAITTAVSDAKYGWNVVNVLDGVKSNSYRYLKIANETNGVALSEIEVYGTVGAGGTVVEPEPPEEEEPLNVSALAYNMTASSNRSDIGTAADVASRLFDGNEATFGNLPTASEYYYVIDFGVGKAVKPTKFSLYPRAD